MLTQDQIKANINALEKQGAKPEEIQGWLNSLSTKQNQSLQQSAQTNQPQTSQPQGQGFLRTAGDIVTGGKFGQNVAQAAYGATDMAGLVPKGQQIGTITNQYVKNGDTLLAIANHTQDPARKQELVKQAQGMYSDAGMVGDSIIGHVRSIEQQVGDAAGLMINLATAGGLGSKALAGSTKAVGIGKGALQGAIQGGLTGGIYGTAQGVASGLQNNKRGGALAGSVVGGAALGAAGGAAVGTVTGAISGGVNSKVLGAKKQELALEQTTSSLSRSEKTAASARTLTGSPTKGVTVVPNNKEIEVAQTALPYIDKNPVASENNIKTAISDISQKDILPSLDQYSNVLDKKPAGSIIVYHGEGSNLPKEGNLFGNGYYVSRTANEAASFGPNQTVGFAKINPQDILTINSQDELNKLYEDAIQRYPKIDLQEALPKYVQKDLGYKAIEGKQFMDGINVFDKNTISEGVASSAKNQLVKSVDSINPSLITKNDPVRKGVYEDFKTKVIQSIQNAKTDKELFNARQTIDDLATQETNGKIWEESGKLNPIYEFWRQARRVINGDLGNRIPGLEDSLRTQTNLYDALEGIAEKTGKLIGKPGTRQVIGTALKKAAIIGGVGAAGGATTLGLARKTGLVK